MNVAYLTDVETVIRQPQSAIYKLDRLFARDVGVIEIEHSIGALGALDDLRN